MIFFYIISKDYDPSILSILIEILKKVFLLYRLLRCKIKKRSKNQVVWSQNVFFKISDLIFFLVEQILHVILDFLEKTAFRTKTINVLKEDFELFVKY